MSPSVKLRCRLFARRLLCSNCCSQVEIIEPVPGAGACTVTEEEEGDVGLPPDSPRSDVTASPGPFLIRKEKHTDGHKE
jgi:hypothetical protein